MGRDAGLSQVDACYQVLRDLITSCELAPGVRLTERELISRLGFGRTPVREALLRLDQDRLIDTLPRCGYRVRPLTRKSIVDFFAVWRAIVPLIVRLATKQMGPEHRARIIALAQERQAMEAPDIAGMSRVSASLFEILIEAADNEPLTYIYRRLGAEMERIFLLFFKTPAGREWVAESGDVEAMGWLTDADAAVKLVEARIAASVNGLLASLDSSANEDSSIWPSGVEQVDAA